MSDLPLLIFDGDCRFCSSSVRWGERFIGRMPVSQPYQFTDLEAVGLTADECGQAVQYVQVDGRAHAGPDAIRALLMDAGKGWRLLARAMGLPGIRWLVAALYRWVARNRHRLPGGTAACALPNSPQR